MNSAGFNAEGRRVVTGSQIVDIRCSRSGRERMTVQLRDGSSGSALANGGEYGRRSRKG